MRDIRTYINLSWHVIPAGICHHNGMREGTAARLLPSAKQGSLLAPIIYILYIFSLKWLGWFYPWPHYALKANALPLSCGGG